MEVDGFPVKQDGFAYTTDSYLRAWRVRSGFHQPDAVDYHRLLADHDVIAKVNSGAVDETIPRVPVSTRPVESTTNSAITSPGIPDAYSEGGKAGGALFTVSSAAFRST